MRTWAVAEERGAASLRQPGRDVETTENLFQKSKKSQRTENRVALFQNSLRFFSADLSAVSAVTSLSKLFYFFETCSLVGLWSQNGREGVSIQHHFWGGGIVLP